LRARTLTAAREALGRTDEPDVWMRIWNSRPAQLAWAATVAVLIFGHLQIGGAMPAGSDHLALPIGAAVGSNEELAEIADLRRVTAALPGWEIATRVPVTQPDQPAESEDLS